MCAVSLRGTDKNQCPTLDNLSDILDLGLPTWGMEIITGFLTGYKHSPCITGKRTMPCWERESSSVLGLWSWAGEDYLFLGFFQGSGFLQFLKPVKKL